MRLNIVFSCGVKSNSRSDFALNNTSFLGVVKHVLQNRTEHIDSASVRTILDLELTHPEGLLFGLKLAMTANRSL